MKTLSYHHIRTSMHHTRLWYNKFMIPYIIQYHTADEGSRYETSETWAPLIWTRGSYLNRHEPDRWLSVKGIVYFQSLALLPMVTLTFGMSWISSSMIPSSLMKEWLMNGSDILRAYSSENGFSSWHFIVIVRLLQRSFFGSLHEKTRNECMTDVIGDDTANLRVKVRGSCLRLQRSN